MYKVKNNYADCHILDLNLIGVHEYKQEVFTPSMVTFLLLSVLAFLTVLTIVAMPELAFFAECQNIKGGDICHITLK
tara:strand:- start:214 stop:444 length:231 start_codon:yes stop_codon:yes gene_type:complete